MIKFNDTKIDGELARRVFVRILRQFGRQRTELTTHDIQETLRESLEQMRERRPYRSRF
jgi:hypothetical protein